MTAGRLGNLGRGASVMLLGTATSRVLGQVRNALLVAAIGVTAAAANAFDVANKLPNILFLLLAGGALNAVLVPQVVRAYKGRGGQEFVDRLVTVAALGLLVLTVVLTAGSSVLVSIYVQDWPPELVSLAVAFGYWCIPQVFFYGLYALLGQVLNAREVFGPYMWAPVVNNVVAIAGLGVFLALFGTYAVGGPTDDLSWWTPGRIALLGAISTAGVVAQALVLFLPLRRAGIRLRPRWGFRGMGLGTAGRVTAWTLAALVVGQLAFVVVSRVAAAASEQMAGAAGNAAYSNAFLLYMLPHSLVTVSLVTALYTRLAGSAVDEAPAAVRADFSLGVRLIAMFTAVATAVLVVLAVPLVRVVLPSTSLDDATAVGRIVAAMALGLTAFGVWSMCQRVYYAHEDAQPLFWFQAVMSVILAVGTGLGALLLPADWWVAGAGLAMALSNVVGALIATQGLRRMLGGVDGAVILRLLVRVTLAAVVAGVLGWALLRLLGGTADGGWLRAVGVTAAGGVLIGAAYVGLLRLMRVRELRELRDVLRSLRRRPASSKGAPSEGAPSEGAPPA